MNDANKSALKELVRTLILAVIPVLVVWLSSPDQTLKAVLISTIIAVLKSIDEWLSKNDLGINKSGLTGF